MFDVYRVRFFSKEMGPEDFEVGCFTSAKEADDAAERLKDALIDAHIKNSCVKIDLVSIDYPNGLEFWLNKIKSKGEKAKMLDKVYRVRFFSDAMGIDDFEVGYFTSAEEADHVVARLKDTFHDACGKNPRVKDDILVGIDVIPINNSDKRVEFWLDQIRTELA